MVGGGKCNIILEEAGEFLGEGRGKLWPPVRDYFGVETKSRENIGETELGNSFGINVFSAGAINYPLCKAMVYHDHNQIIPVGVGESHDEIHRYGGEWEGSFDSQRGESRHHGVCIYLGHLAVGASQDKLPEEGGHSWPPIVLLHPMKSSEEPFVSPGGGFMERLYQVVVGQFRDVEAVFEIQGIVNEFPVGHSGSRNPQFAIVFVHGGEGFSDNQISFGGGGDLFSKGSVDGVDVEILVLSL